jgi:drug/metabolite transporter (DMT)-like permease
VPALAFLWFYNGVNFLAFKVGVEALPAAFLAATRFTVAGLMMLPVAAWRVRAGERPNGRSLVTAGLLGINMLVGGQALAIWGVHYLPAGTASVFGSTPPLYLALFTWLFFRQPLARSQLAGGCIGFVGTALLGWSSAAGGGFSPVGAAAILAATACWAAGSLAARRVSLPRDPVVNLTVQLLTAGALLWLLSWLSGAKFEVGDVPFRSWAALAFLTVVSTLLGYSVFSWMNQAVSPTLANSYNYVAPVITLGLASLFLGERLSWPKAAAAAVALGGVALMISGKGPDRSEVA